MLLWWHVWAFFDTVGIVYTKREYSFFGAFGMNFTLFEKKNLVKFLLVFLSLNFFKTRIGKNENLSFM